MRGYCWRVGSTVELGVKCPECGSLHDPIPDQTKCAAYCEVGGGRGEPCVLPYGHEGRCSLYDWPEGRVPEDRPLPDSPGLDGQASATNQAGNVPVPNGDER